MLVVEGRSGSVSTMMLLKSRIPLTKNVDRDGWSMRSVARNRVLSRHHLKIGKRQRVIAAVPRRPASGTAVVLMREISRARIKD